MAKVQIEAILKLTDVDINPRIFQQISRSVAGMPTALKQTGQEAAKATTSIQSIGQAATKTNQELDHTSKIAQLIFQRMTQFAILLPIFATLNKAIQGGAKFMGDFNDAILDIVRVAPSLRNQMDSIKESVLDIAIELGSTADKVVGTTKVFIQAGQDITTALENTRQATLASKVTTLSLVQAQEVLIQSAKQFEGQGITSAAIIDKLSKVEDVAAVEAQDLGEAFQTGGNALIFATKSIDATLGLITSLREQTRKSGSEIGTFFKTLSTRILAAGESKSAVEGLGVAVQNLDGSLRPLQTILTELKVKFDGMTESQQANAAKSIAGVRQFESLLAVLKSIDRANEVSAISADSNGTAQRKLAIEAEKVGFQVDQLISQFQAFAAAVGESGVLDDFKKILQVVTNLGAGLTEIAKVAKALHIDLTPLLAIGALKLGQKVFNVGQQQAQSTLGGITKGSTSSVDSAAKGTTIALNELTAVTQRSIVALGNFGIELKSAKDIRFDKFTKGLENISQSQLRTIKDRVLESSSIQATAIKFGALITASTGLSQVSDALSEAMKHATSNFERGIEQFGASATKAASLGAQFALINPQVGLVVGALSLLVDSFTNFSKGMSDITKQFQQVHDENLFNTIKDQLQNSISKDSFSNFDNTFGKDITLALVHALQANIHAKNPLQVALGDLAKNTGLKARFEDINKTGVIDPKIFEQALKEIINPDLVKTLAIKLKGGLVENLGKGAFENTQFTNLQDELQKQQLDSTLKTLDTTKLFSAFLTDLGRTEEDTIKATRGLQGSVEDLFNTAEGLKSLNDLVDDTSNLSTALEEFQNQQKEGIGIYKDEIDVRKNALNLLRFAVEAASQKRSNTADFIARNPAQFKFGPEFNAQGQITKAASTVATEFLQRLQDAAKNAPDKLDTIIADQFKGEAAPKEITDFIKLITEGAKAQTQVKQAELSLEEAIQSKQLEADKINRENANLLADAALKAKNAMIDLGLGTDAASADLDVLRGLTLKDYEDILKGVSSQSDKIKHAVLSIAGADEQKAAEQSRIAHEKAITDIEQLTKSVDDLRASAGRAQSELDQKRPAVDPVNQRKLLAIQEELGKKEADLAQKKGQLQTDEAKKAVESLDKTKKANDEAKLAADKLAKTLSDLKIQLNDAKREFDNFITQKNIDLINQEGEAQAKLKETERGVLDATQKVSEANLNFIKSIIAFNDAMASAKVQTGQFQIQIDSLGGGLNTLDGRLGALDKVFANTLNNANISLQKRIELERQLADETLSFLQNTQQQITGAGLNVVGQDFGQNRALNQGIQGLQAIATKLGGSFDNFLKLNSDTFKAVSQQILNLPVELRKNMLDALQSLPSTVSIGGFSVEQLKTALGQVGAGVAPEVGLPSTEELIVKQTDQLQKLQDLSLQDANLQQAQIVAALDALNTAKTNLDQAKAYQDKSLKALDDVRTTVIEEKGVLDAAADQREELTNRITSATSQAAVEHSQALAREFATQQQFEGGKYDDIIDKLQKTIDAIGTIRISVLKAEASPNLTGFPGNIDILGGAKGYIPNFANGLSVKEAQGILEAASKEKQMMPPGATLAVANTSEAIIPVRNRGFIPNFATGNSPSQGSSISATIDSIRGLNKTAIAAISRSVTPRIVGGDKDTATGIETNKLIITRLTSVLSELQKISDSTGIVSTSVQAADKAGGTTTALPAGGPVNLGEVTINLNTNQNNTVSVQGLQNLKDTLADGIRQAQNQQVNAQLGPITDTIETIFQALQNRGLLNSFGQGR